MTMESRTGITLGLDILVPFEVGQEYGKRLQEIKDHYEKEDTRLREAFDSGQRKNCKLRYAKVAQLNKETLDKYKNGEFSL